LKSWTRTACEIRTRKNSCAFPSKARERSLPSETPNLTSLESFQQPQRTTYDGRCLAILKSKRAPGVIKLTARADGLGESSVEIKTQAN
jgi:hypothetical protein